MLLTSGGQRNVLRSEDVLLFRFRLPGAPGFIRVLQMLSEEAKAQGLPVARIVIMDASKKSLSCLPQQAMSMYTRHAVRMGQKPER